MADWKNTLYYGDNLKILREYIADESIDLIYLDPPFNSNRNYNVLFKDESGQESEAQLTAFDDTWHWDKSAEEAYHELITEAPPKISSMIGALREFIGTNQMMAYLVMMTTRLIELHRVLKPTGSLYLHCDTSASHYLKIVLDVIFSVENFRHEITWKRSHAHSDSKQGRKGYGNIADIILFYTKSEKYTFNTQYQPYSQEYIDKYYRYKDPDGRRYWLDNLTGPGGASKGNPQYEVMGVTRYWRYSEKKMNELIAQGRVVQSKPGNVPQYKRYLDEMPGIPLQNIWNDIDPINMMAKERLGYPTQKPVALLERIINVSSNENDIVLGPFCGCGTAIHAAQKLKRCWIGIDITHLAIALQKYRLKDAFELVEKQDYDVIGEPEDLQAAKQLALDDRYQFQWWALSLIQAQPLGGEAGKKQGKKGSDKGIDGVITFLDDLKSKPKKLIVQVKSGKVKSGDIRDLIGTLEQEHAAIGVFITLESATKDMKMAAVSAGFYHSSNWNKDYPKLQIFTIEELLNGATVQMPPTARTYKKAQREIIQQGEQQILL